MPGLTLPFDKEKRQAAFFAANQLVTQPVASPMTDILLKELEIPGWQKILKKYQSWIDFVKFLELNQAVIDGRITPEQGIALLVKEATARFQQQQQSIQGAERINEQEKERAKGQGQTAT